MLFILSEGQSVRAIVRKFLEDDSRTLLERFHDTYVDLLIDATLERVTSLPDGRVKDNLLRELEKMKGQEDGCSSSAHHDEAPQ